MSKRLMLAAFIPAAVLALTAPAAAQQRGGGFGAAPEQFVERLMESDADGDGKLTRDELPERMADRLFDMINTNDDEFLDADEIKAFAANRGGDRPLRGGDRAGRRGGGNTASFGGSMRQAGRALRRLRSSALDAASHDSDLEHIQSIQSSLIAAKSSLASVRMSEPARTKYEGDEAAYRLGLRQALIKTISETLTLEMAVADGHADKALAIRMRLLELQETNHDLFQGGDEDRTARPRRPEGRGRGAGRRGPGEGGGGPGR